MSGIRLGKVVKSNNHCDYVVEVDDRLGVKNPPSPDAYAFGSFVKLGSEQGRWEIGIIYNTQLFNPTFLNNGPRLSSEPSPIFSPDLQTEMRTLLGVVLVGSLESVGDRQYGVQGIPRSVVPIHTVAYRMSDEEVYQFHQDRAGDTQFAYYGLLLNCGGTFAPHLLQQVLNEVSLMFFGQQRRALQILSKELTWKITMGAMK
ncbi:MAG: hypothetical protein OHK0012_11960 [Synechococcales cyanobacterium]